MKLYIIVIFAIIVLYLYNNNNKNKQLYTETDKSNINIWMYLPIINHNYKNNFRYPLTNKEFIVDYLKLSNNTIIKNMNYSDCNINILTKYNLYDYLPDFPIDMTKESKYKEKELLDLIGGMLLYRYGGLWLSPGSICIRKDYSELFHNIINYDIVTFGSSNPYSCDNLNPNNYIIGSKKNNKVIEEYINRLLQHMTGNITSLHKNITNDYNPLGEAIQLYSINRKHYDCKCDGTYNVYNRKLRLEDYLGKNPIIYDKNKLEIISFPYDLLNLQTNFEWFKFMQTDDIKNSGINVSYFL
jgi:hypothetical protein